jgi:hypothetical protein
MTASPNELLWDRHDRRQECERRTKAPALLAALANYVHSYSALFVRNGSQMLTPAPTNQRRQRIALADRLDRLAKKTSEVSAKYQQFEVLLGELHAAGFFADSEPVSTLAAVLVLGEPR